MKAVERVVFSVLEQEGVERDRAAERAQYVVSVICKTHGGFRHYVPVPSSRERDEKIISAWRSKQSRVEIAKANKVSLSTVDRVITRHLKQKAKQSLGFGSENWVLK